MRKSSKPRFLLRCLLWLFLLPAAAQADTCYVCGKDTLWIVYMIDKVSEDRRVVCPPCSRLRTRCFFCGLPAKEAFIELVDGRVICARDGKDVVLDEAAARHICTEAKAELARLFSRFTTFPDTNTTITIVDQIQMQQLVQTPGFERQCPSIFGYVRSRVGQGGGWRHPISLLSGLPKHRLMAVCAHEIGHTWVRENVAPTRGMDRDAEEGFCELIAYRLMEYLNQQTDMNSIKENRYTRGQVDQFLEADTAYGFYTIMQWMKWGTDSRLSNEEPDRIRRIEEKAPRSDPVALNPVPLITGPTPVPDALTLVGILGTGSKRLALINDCSLSIGESGKVRFAKTNTVVRCVEIRANSVVVEVGEEKQREELFLKGK
jgi:protein DA1